MGRQLEYIKRSAIFIVKNSFETSLKANLERQIFGDKNKVKFNSADNKLDIQ